MKSALVLAAVVASCFVFGSALHAATVVNATGNFEINQYSSNGSGNRQRSLSGAVGGLPGVVVQSFAIPALGPGQSITAASYTTPAATFFFGPGTDGGNTIDLAALTAATGGAGGAPASGQDTAAGTLLESAFLSGNAGGGSLLAASTDATANTLLTSFLNANAGSYIYLRLSPEVATGGFDGYDIYNNSTGGDGGYNSGPAFLTFDVSTPTSPVPEPASLSLLTLGSVLLLRRRA